MPFESLIINGSVAMADSSLKSACAALTHKMATEGAADRMAGTGTNACKSRIRLAVCIAVSALCSLFSFDLNASDLNMAQNDSIVPIKLDESVITAHNEFIKTTPDGYVVAVGGNIETKGKETADILKQMPSLRVTDDALSMVGKDAVFVNMNGRQIRLSGRTLLEYLNSLPPDIIKSIEIIKTPPARYDAEGNIGIVNIVTKTTVLPGWKGNLKLEYGQATYPTYMGSGYAGYTGKKLFFDGTVAADDITYLNNPKYSCYYPSETVSTSNPMKWNTQDAVASLSLGCNLDQKTTLVLDVKLPLYDKGTYEDLANDTQFINAYTGQVDSTLNSKGKSLKNSRAFISGLYFSHKFDSCSSFTASADYLTDRASTSRQFTSSSTAGGIATPIEDYSSSGKMNYDIATSKGDFEFPLLSCKAGAGGKVTFIRTKSDNSFSGSVTASDIFSYDENVQALYFNLSRQFAKWSFKAGLRAEATQTTGVSSSTGESHASHYIDIFPTAGVSTDIGKTGSLSLNYSKRIARPSYSMLDPFKWYISKYNYSVGNPFLTPSYIDNVELTYLLGDSFQTSAYFTAQRDMIGSLVVLDSLDCLSSIEIANNYLDANSFGINIYKSIRPTAWYSAIIQGDFKYQNYHSNRSEFQSISGFGGMVTMNNTFSIGEMFQVTCGLSDNIPGLYNYRKYKNSFQADIGVTFIHSRSGITIGILASDIFKSSSPEYYYVSDGVKQVFNNYYDSRSILLSFKWRFGNWFNRTVCTSSSNDEERQRL
jgi:hypothetical protein